jgi:uncharacterized protein YneF (UPF0154 family)
MISYVWMAAFPDTDGCFGSVGSFFSTRLTEGSYEANPPFVPEVMSQMGLHMEVRNIQETFSAHLGNV